MLSMADELYSALAKKQKAHGYMTTQEVINDILRRSLFSQSTGRPKKSDDPFIDHFSRPR